MDPFYKAQEINDNFNVINDAKAKTYKIEDRKLAQRKRIKAKISLSNENLLLRGCILKNTDFIEGIVVYAGHETKAMLNNRGPRYKRSKLERKINQDVIWCVILLLFLCFFCAIGSGIWLSNFNGLTDNTNYVPFIPFGDLDKFNPVYQGFIVFWTYIIIFQTVIPLPMYVSLELVKIAQVYFINNDNDVYHEPSNKRLECRALNITEDLGQIEYIFSDKTGTLTENLVEFKTCTIGGVDYPHMPGDEESGFGSQMSIARNEECCKRLVSATVTSAQILNQPDVSTLRTDDLPMGPVATNADRAATTTSQTIPGNLVQQIMKLMEDRYGMEKIQPAQDLSLREGSTADVSPEGPPINAVLHVDHLAIHLVDRLIGPPRRSPRRSPHRSIRRSTHKPSQKSSVRSPHTSPCTAVQVYRTPPQSPSEEYHRPLTNAPDTEDDGGIIFSDAEIRYWMANNLDLALPSEENNPAHTYLMREDDADTITLPPIDPIATVQQNLDKAFQTATKTQAPHLPQFNAKKFFAHNMDPFYKAQEIDDNFKFINDAKAKTYKIEDRKLAQRHQADITEILRKIEVHWFTESTGQEDGRIQRWKGRFSPPIWQLQWRIWKRQGTQRLPQLLTMKATAARVSEIHALDYERTCFDENQNTVHMGLRWEFIDQESNARRAADRSRRVGPVMDKSAESLTSQLLSDDLLPSGVPLEFPSEERRGTKSATSKKRPATPDIPSSQPKTRKSSTTRRRLRTPRASTTTTGEIVEGFAETFANPQSLISAQVTLQAQFAGPLTMPMSMQVSAQFTTQVSAQVFAEVSAQDDDVNTITLPLIDPIAAVPENLDAAFKSATKAQAPHLPQFNAKKFSFHNMDPFLKIYENLPMEPALKRELSNMCLRSLDSVERTIPEHVKRVQEFFLLMAVCNTVMVSHHPHQDERTRYEAESPDELALVKAASTYGCRLLQRSPERVSVFLPGDGEVEFEVLHILSFDSVRKRMSVIIKHPETEEITLYVKGADSSILSVLDRKFRMNDTEEKAVRVKTEEHITDYAMKGLRTLCMAKRTLSQEVYKDWLKMHQEAESSLEDREIKIRDSACRIEEELDLLGATGIEDRLQDGVPETIAKLRKAGINIWVLTGDKQETVIEIAFASTLFRLNQELVTLNSNTQEEAKDLIVHHTEQINLNRPSPSRDGLPAKEKEYALIIDGKTLAFALHDNSSKKAFLNLTKKCNSVVCCRATPIQKGHVVKLVKEELKKLTLAIGDGANDVSMIQTADIGIGISGQEGMQAVMSSDFAIARFKYLERLLLVHGHWCYNRLSKFGAFMFYKSLMSVMTLFWFQFFSGFSGSLMLDSIYMMLLHLIFTSLPPIVNGIFDKDVTAEVLLEKPELYSVGQKGEMYTNWTFLMVLLDAIYQSAVLYFIAHLAYTAENAGIWEYGTTIMTALILIILLHLVIETNSWIWIQRLILIMTFLSFWVIAVVSNAIFFTWDHPSNPYWVMENTISTPIHSCVVIISCVVALLPRLCIRAIQATVWPSAIMKVKQLEKELIDCDQQTTITTETTIREAVDNSPDSARKGGNPQLNKLSVDYRQRVRERHKFPSDQTVDSVSPI
ncbi:phospholipid-transporting ATPase VD-like [Haliotis rubra]|uniref:phospholipid-transporting ATPase VD-like n=1 Tax=Haliotis rubra TaxID=36100 RepID=UPI001EE4EDFA|nr:phospholipid-transporting ATPase VD-like [Haliotis rubra]